MPELDLGSYLSDDSLLLKGIASKRYEQGHEYSVPSPNAIDGLKLRRVMNLTGDNPLKNLNPEAAMAFREFCTDEQGEQIEFAEKLLGPAHAEMVADGVSLDRLDQITRIVALNFGGGTELAQMVVAAAEGEARARANRAARRAKSAAKAPGKTPRKAATTKRTAKSTAGSKSGRASTPTPARTRSPRATTPSSGRSSTSPSGRAAAKAV